MKTTLVMAILCLFSTLLSAQNLTQTIRGKVTDRDSKIPLIGVNVVVTGSNPVIGTATSSEGEFIIEKLPIGRYNLEVYYIGYQPKIINDILIGAGKEAVLTIEMIESVEKLDEIIVKAKKHKSEPLNKMAMVSARSFSVEETKRYAGSFDDPARMASAFAGVSANPDGDNDIIIRGNSPRGLLWMLEEIEIPNPNHFADEGATGGPISTLNNNILSNSDFFSGAFPAEYGNSYSGVFDIKLRTGNNNKREYSTKVGLLGVDCSLEGPFKKNWKSSYLFNYRYSTLAMLNTIGIRIVGDAVPDFQDVALNLVFPTKKLGTFKIFGIGGISHIEDSDVDYQDDFGTDMVALGINNTLILNGKSYLKSTIAFTGSKNDWTYKEPEPVEFILKGRDDFTYYTFKGKLVYNHKFNAKSTLNTGATFSNLKYSLFSEHYDELKKEIFPDVNRKGQTNLLQTYVSWKYSVSDELTFQSGIHYTYFFLNKNQSLEPRIGLKWQVNQKQSISAGFGLHSKVESLTNYLAFDVLEDGTKIQYNKNLDFTKARHFVLGYENLISENLLMKIETYYQDLYNVPIENDPESSFSALNSSYGYATIDLVNKGKGYNYGIEFTLEKFFSKNYYFLLTSSLFESKYKAMDGIWRNTRYNNNHVSNLLAGKEFKIRSNGVVSSLNVSTRITYAGGMRYTPIDLEQSIIEQETVRSDELAFSAQRDPFLKIDLKLSYRKNKKKTTRVWELDIQNVIGQANISGDWFDTSDNQIETWTQMGFLPVLSYRIEF